MTGPLEPVDTRDQIRFNRWLINLRNYVNQLLTESSGLVSLAWSKINFSGSNLTDLETKSHTVLSDIGTNSHADIDSHITTTNAHIAVAEAHISSSSGVHGATGDIVGTTDNQTLTNKLLSGYDVSIRTVTSSSYTVISTDVIIFVDASSNDVTLNLPAASSNTGKIYEVKKIDASANLVIVDGNGSETIDGSTTVTINTQYESITIACNGSGWYIV